MRVRVRVRVRVRARARQGGVDERTTAWGMKWPAVPRGRIHSLLCHHMSYLVDAARVETPRRAGNALLSLVGGHVVRPAARRGAIERVPMADSF